MKRWLFTILYFFVCFGVSAQHVRDSDFRGGKYAEEEILTLVLRLPRASLIIYDIPCISPVQSRNFDNLRISSGYGTRVHPITQRVHKHSGIDLPPTGNDTIYATANGRVDTVAYGDKLGLYIRLRHKYGYKTVYGHLTQTFIRTPRQRIRIGQPLGIMGTTGRSTGKHLHYTILHNGRNVPPLPYCYLFIKNRESNYEL